MKTACLKTQRALALVTIIVLAFLDQLSKWYVIERFFKLQSFDNHEAERGFLNWLLTLPQQRAPYIQNEIFPFFNLVMVWNKGVSFGMFASQQSFMPYALMAMALSLTALFIVWIWRSTSFWSILPMAMVVSGALSNVWDRARFGAVADFLDFHLGMLHWPAFNIADSCIVVGVFGLALHTLLTGKTHSPVSTTPDQI